MMNWLFNWTAWKLDVAPWIIALRGLCSREYWRRLWCLQELKLAKAKDIMCGSKVIPWVHFEHFMIMMYYHPPFHRYQLGPAWSMVEAMPRYLSTSLWELLHTTGHLLCEEKKDKAYALLGLATRDAASIQPYYALDMSVFLNRILKCHIEHDLINDEHMIQDADGLTLRKIASCCDHLEKLFETGPGTIFQLSDSASHLKEPSLIYRRLSTRSTAVQGMSLLWAIHYDHHPRVQELMKVVHRRHSPCSYVLSGLFFAGSVAAIPFAVKIKPLLGIGIVLVVFLFAMAFFSLAMCIQHTRTRYSYRVPERRSISWRTLTFVPFVLGELSIHYATSAFNHLKQWWFLLTTRQRDERGATGAS